MKKRFSEEQIVRILRQAEAANQTVADVCKAQRISEQTRYHWPELGKTGPNVPSPRVNSVILERRSARHSIQRLQFLQRQNPAPIVHKISNGHLARTE